MDDRKHIREAWRRIALAGRELGQGPMAAVERLAPEVISYFEEALRDRPHPRRDEALRKAGVAPPSDEERRRDAQTRARLIAAGFALARIVEGHEPTLAELDAIHEEWRRQA